MNCPGCWNWRPVTEYKVRGKKAHFVYNFSTAPYPFVLTALLFIFSTFHTSLFFPLSSHHPLTLAVSSSRLLPLSFPISPSRSVSHLLFYIHPCEFYFYLFFFKLSYFAKKICCIFTRDLGREKAKRISQSVSCKYTLFLHLRWSYFGTEVSWIGVLIIYLTLSYKMLVLLWVIFENCKIGVILI